MTIDWFTFAAQILNFLVLIWLMKKFLYGPIVNAMEEREIRIAARLTAAAAAERSAATREDQYRSKLNELAETRQELLAQASREVDEWRKDHIQQAKTEIEVDRERWQQSLAREKIALLQEIQLNVTNHATDLSRHIMKDMADESLQGLMVKRFLKLVRKSDPRTLQIHSGGNQPTVIETSHELSESEQRSIREVIVGLDSSVQNLEFKINPQLICGIELWSPGCKLGWTVRDSLSDMESDLLKCFDNMIPDVIAEQSNLQAQTVATDPVAS